MKKHSGSENKLKIELHDTKVLHNKDFKNAHHDFIQKEKEMKSKMGLLQKEFDEYQSIVGKEINVKDLLLQRSNDYWDILK